MDRFADIVCHWGYWAVFIGTLLEGEVTMVVSGFLASQNLMDLKGVLFVGMVGGFLGDQLFYLLGRISNRTRLLKRLERNVTYRKARRVVRKYGNYIILFSRYLVGMRMALSFSLGVMRIPFASFSLLNLVSAVVWALTVGYAGYALGTLALKLLGDLKRYELALVVFSLFVALVAFAVKRCVERIEERRLS